ncbi:MAG: chloramphenicol phosphotransferase CPT family protein [Nitrospira sp.]|nr:chloramphenicol phosphotransferase CPT family protein [Nitrospira sp.]
MVSPQIICLNGTSSAGKTAIAKQQLQENCCQRFHLNFSIDSIPEYPAPSALTACDSWQDIADLNYPHLVGSFNACVARLVELPFSGDRQCDGSNRTRHRLPERVQGYSILLVGVHCSLEELNRRERQRQDRTIGKRLRSSIGYIGVSCMMLKSIRALKAQLSWLRDYGL